MTLECATTLCLRNFKISRKPRPLIQKSFTITTKLFLINYWKNRIAQWYIESTTVFKRKGLAPDPYESLLILITNHLHIPPNDSLAKILIAYGIISNIENLINDSSLRKVLVLNSTSKKQFKYSLVVKVVFDEINTKNLSDASFFICQSNLGISMPYPLW